MKYKAIVEHHINLVGHDASEEDKQYVMNIILHEKNNSAEHIISKLSFMQMKLLITYCSTMHKTFIDEDDKKYILLRTTAGLYIFEVTENNIMKPFAGDELFGKFRSVFVQQNDTTSYAMFITYNDYILYKITAKMADDIVQNNTAVKFDNFCVYNHQYILDQADKVRLAKAIKAILESRAVLTSIAGEY